jgi:multiple sugar transport system ATP-binding protein
MAELTLDSITKVFDDDGEDVVAVDDVSVDIDDGEFLVLVGPSGCGKSTTLRMIAGIETVTEGEMRLDEHAITDREPSDRNVAMVFQSYALYPHMTVAGNMRFGLEESTEMSSDAIQETVEDAAAMLGIEELLERKPEDLSGGQQQRVALGRAIVRDPDVFLMDEPLSNLDASLRAQMRAELQELQTDLGVTTVYVTHDQTEAMTMGDRIAVLNDGQLQQVGTPLECYHEPANRFVAGFIGEPSMNFVETTVEGDRLVADGFEYPLDGATAEAVREGQGVTLGIRPENVELVDAAETDHDIEATVTVVEPMGNENNVHFDLSGESDDLIAVTGGFDPVDHGDDIVVRFPEDAVHLFDSRTGETLRNRRLDVEQPAEPRV